MSGSSGIKKTKTDMPEQTTRVAFNNNISGADPWGPQIPDVQFWLNAFRVSDDEVEMFLPESEQPPHQPILRLFADRGVSSYALQSYSPLPDIASSDEPRLVRDLSGTYARSQISIRRLGFIEPRNENRAFSVRSQATRQAPGERREDLATSRLAQVTEACGKMMRLHRIYWVGIAVSAAMIAVLLGLALARIVPAWLAIPLPVILTFFTVPLTLGATVWISTNDFGQSVHRDKETQRH